uniref:Uncharacterized protein n=2 Tax=Phaeomonas parva TaxID=124430 RepID=A0A7S1UGK6_9STRA
MAEERLHLDEQPWVVSDVQTRAVHVSRSRSPGRRPRSPAAGSPAGSTPGQPTTPWSPSPVRESRPDRRRESADALRESPLAPQTPPPHSPPPPQPKSVGPTSAPTYVQARSEAFTGDKRPPPAAAPPSSLEERCRIAEQMMELYQRQLQRLTGENQRLRRRVTHHHEERQRLTRVIEHLSAIVETQSSVVFAPGDHESTSSPSDDGRLPRSPPPMRRRARDEMKRPEQQQQQQNALKAERFRMRMRYDKPTRVPRAALREVPDPYASVKLDESGEYDVVVSDLKDDPEHSQEVPLEAAAAHGDASAAAPEGGWRRSIVAAGGMVNVSVSWPPEAAAKVSQEDEEEEQEPAALATGSGAKPVAASPSISVQGRFADGDTSFEYNEQGSFELIQAYYG